MRRPIVALLLGLTLFTSLGAFAGSLSTVVTVETDAFPGLFYFDVERDQTGSIDALVYRSSAGLQRFSVEQLARGPQILKQVENRNIILLSVEPDFTPERGGHANLRFLQSGISNTYRNFRMLIDNQRDIVLRADPNWSDRESDRSRYTSVFNYLFLRANKLFSKVVGVRGVEPAQR